MTRDKIYFISDLHLGAGYIKDPRAHELRVCRFLDAISADAAELYLLGDALDYWFEYRTVVPRGYIRFFGNLARLADAGVKIFWFIGNHDIWLFDYLRDEIGLTVIDGYEVKEIAGKRFFLSHGDGVGKLPPLFRMLRATFRNSVCQKLYSGIHPRWTIPFAKGWSKSSRGDEYLSTPVFQGENGDPLVKFCRDYLNEHPGQHIDYFVFGHRHVAVDYPLAHECRMIILGDWITQNTYAVFNGENLELKNFTSFNF